MVSPIHVPRFSQRHDALGDVVQVQRRWSDSANVRQSEQERFRRQRLQQYEGQQQQQQAGQKKQQQHLHQFQPKFDRQSDLLKHADVSEILNGRYEIIRRICSTTTSEVLCCRDILLKSGTAQVAVKVFRGQGLSDLGLQEYATLARLVAAGGREHVVRPIEVVSAGKGDAQVTCVVLELLGDTLHALRAVLPRLPVFSVRKIARKLLLDLDFVHRSGFLHADIKPGNIAFDLQKSTIKLLDFGNAMELEDASMYFDKFEVQTLRYRAPEVLFGCENFGHKIDVWSVGLALLEMCTGRPVFDARSEEDLVEQWRVFFGPLPPQPFAHGKFFANRFQLSEKKCQDKIAHKQKMGLGQNDMEVDDSPCDNVQIASIKNSLVGTESKTRQSIKRFLSSALSPLGASELAVDFFYGLLRIDPQHRIPAQQGVNHLFLTHNEIVTPSRRPSIG